jgi:hypothetical protein
VTVILPITLFHGLLINDAFHVGVCKLFVKFLIKFILHLHDEETVKMLRVTLMIDIVMEEFSWIVECLRKVRKKC